jgi:hypothetical protein
MIKICSKCGKDENQVKFNKKGFTRNGVQRYYPYCKICQSLINNKNNAGIVGTLLNFSSDYEVAKYLKDHPIKRTLANSLLEAMANYHFNNNRTAGA